MKKQTFLKLLIIVATIVLLTEPVVLRDIDIGRNPVPVGENWAIFPGESIVINESVAATNDDLRTTFEAALVSRATFYKEAPGAWDTLPAWYWICCSLICAFIFVKIKNRIVKIVNDKASEFFSESDVERQRRDRDLALQIHLARLRGTKVGKS